MFLRKGGVDVVFIFCIMFATGLASLLYQITLLTVVNTLVGATEIAASLVVASFLLGLALGAFFGGKIFSLKRPILTLVSIELLIALFGFGYLEIIQLLAASAFSVNTIFWVIIFSLLIPTALMGMEIPLAVAYLEKVVKKKNATGFVYGADTFGGVVGALIAGIVVIPLVGFKGAMWLGATLNMITALFAVLLPQKEHIKKGVLIVSAVFLIFFLSQIWIHNEEANKKFADSFYGVGSLFYETYYATPIISTTTPYQHILVLDTPYYGNQLLLGGQYQTSEKESIRYHEYLTLPALAAVPNVQRVLVIGGGDGGVLNQLLKRNITTIHQVELDQEVIEISREYMKGVHRGALNDDSIQRTIGDGRRYLRESADESFDVVILDLPDPEKIAVAPLYTKEFYEEVKRVLTPEGVLVTQASSPYLFLEGYTSMTRTINSVFKHTYPYVFPGSAAGSFGYIIAGKTQDPRTVRDTSVEGTWYTQEDNEVLFYFPRWLREYFTTSDIDISTDNNPMIHVYMQSGYYFRGVADPDYEEE